MAAPLEHGDSRLLGDGPDRPDCLGPRRSVRHEGRLDPGSCGLDHQRHHHLRAGIRQRGLLYYDLRLRPEMAARDNDIAMSLNIALLFILLLLLMVSTSARGYVTCQNAYASS